MTTSEIAGVRALLAGMNAPGQVPPTYAERRARMDASGGFSPLPEGHVFEIGTLGGMPVERHHPKGADPSRVLLYLHGGAYCIGSPISHRPLAARLAHEAGCLAVVPDYRLAPEHVFPAAVDDGLASYRALLEEGFAPERIVIAGDSAGGGLTLATVLAAREAGLPLPAGLFVISPWSDLTSSGPSYAAKAATDPMISAEGLEQSIAAYLGDQSPEHILASPNRGDYTGLPPILIQVGSEEVLLSDSIGLAERAAMAGTEVRLEVWPEMIHVWHAFYSVLEPARQAITGAADWIAARTR